MVLAAQVLEEAAAFAEEDRDQVDLDLVEDAGGEGQLGDAGAVDEDVPVARRLPGPGHRGLNVVEVGHQRPMGVGAGLLAAEDEDRDAVVVVAGPPLRRLEGAAAGDDRAGRHRLVHRLAVDALRPTRHAAVLGRGAGEDPLVQALAAVAEAVVDPLVGAGDEAIQGHRHEEHGRGHLFLLQLLAARTWVTPPSG
jgi:hypothetical protein